LVALQSLISVPIGLVSFKITEHDARHKSWGDMILPLGSR
jgi:hypothetical protein